MPVKENILTFEQVCNEIAGEPASLLLGNGFSITYDSSFDYSKLKDKIFENAFDDFATMDVEEIMLKVSNYPRYLVESLKKSFIRAISTVHPEYLADEKIRSCAVFLKHFSKVYTLNYDLLLYWAINSDDELKKLFIDGFGISREKRMSNWPNAGKTSTFYLHGSLLLHCSKPSDDPTPCPRKPTECYIAKYKKPKLLTGNLISLLSLIDNLKRFLKNGQYPHFVSEGHHRQKYSRIQKCTYLKGCYEALKNESDNLVTYGVSFEKDLHILSAINSSKVKHCYIGIYNKDPKANLLLNAAKSLANTHDVKVYNAETAKVWQ